MRLRDIVYVGCNLVLLQQVSKVQNRCLIQDAVTRERELGKVAYRDAVVERFFYDRIREVEPEYRSPREFRRHQDLSTQG